MLQPKVRKRYIFIAALPMVYQSLVAPITGSLFEGNGTSPGPKPEISYIREFIASQRPSIKEEELELLTQTVQKESLRIEDSACGLYCEKGEKVGLLLGLIWTESEFYKKARSKKNARGYMQIMPGTGAWIGSWEGKTVKEKDLFETETNIHLGVSYLNHLLETEKGDVRRALLSYNAGPGAVKKWGGVPSYAENIFSTQADYLGSRN
ncbi:lytic transglycosylase domain-containing protein [Leptospira semungkisensis]|uniref:Lytic transglycosylase domain-containing protein n=1 Tax=Leptospira semungkisensis TaxID=2484985 RepID=A0A4R9FUH5_9LEPT|nr:lytic transglycosylase domain-containing protein [Leptospira semungkisensis]TGK01647.1 lytic transglycosylase domain-containing protein [Leptospira semungkisensis]